MATWVNLLDVIYPVGSIYHSTSSTSPASSIGGTWSAISGRFLLGANSNYVGGSQGGEASVTLTTDTMPHHYHSMRMGWGDFSGNVWVDGASSNATLSVDQGATTYGVGGASSQQYAALLRSLYLEKNRVETWLEVLYNAFDN